jgi:hypothetical protein
MLHRNLDNVRLYGVVKNGEAVHEGTVKREAERLYKQVKREVIKDKVGTAVFQTYVGPFGTPEVIEEIDIDLRIPDDYK